MRTLAHITRLKREFLPVLEWPGGNCIGRRTCCVIMSDPLRSERASMMHDAYPLASLRRMPETLLQSNSETVKKTNEPMGQARRKITLDASAQAQTPPEQAARSRVVEMIAGKFRLHPNRPTQESVTLGKSLT